MRWRELGGSTVTEPTRRDFRTFIIEQSLSSLDGEANIRLTCRCCLRYVASNQEGEASNTREAMISSRVLVVEDDTLLAFEMQDILSDAGYDVVGPAATVAEALALIDSQDPPCRLCRLQSQWRACHSRRARACRKEHPLRCCDRLRSREPSGCIQQRLICRKAFQGGPSSGNCAVALVRLPALAAMPGAMKFRAPSALPHLRRNHCAVADYLLKKCDRVVLRNTEKDSHFARGRRTR